MKHRMKVRMEGLTKYYGDQPKAGVVSIVIDMDKLTRMLGRTAAWNRTNKTRAMKGAITATFKEEEKKPAHWGNPADYDSARGEPIGQEMSHD